MIDLMLTHRQTGRTTELMRWLREGADAGEKRVLYVHSQGEAIRVYEEVEKWYLDRDMNCPVERWQITTPDRKPMGKDVKAVAIDNLELQLYYLTGPYKVDTITLDSACYNLVENV